MGRMEHMFEWLTAKAIMEQALPLAAWLQAYSADIEARAWQELWIAVPWWFRLIMVAYVVAGVISMLKRWSRRLGISR